MKPLEMPQSSPVPLMPTSWCTSLGSITHARACTHKGKRPFNQRSPVRYPRVPWRYSRHSLQSLHPAVKEGQQSSSYLHRWDYAMQIMDEFKRMWSYSTIRIDVHNECKDECECTCNVVNTTKKCSNDAPLQKSRDSRADRFCMQKNQVHGCCLSAPKIGPRTGQLLIQRKQTNTAHSSRFLFVSSQSRGRKTAHLRTQNSEILLSRNN